jgi:hypothetical protein
MPDSNFEIQSQICDNLGTSVWYSVGAVLNLNGRIAASD